MDGSEAAVPVEQKAHKANIVTSWGRAAAAGGGGAGAEKLGAAAQRPMAPGAAEAGEPLGILCAFVKLVG